ncbi:sulfotransferase family protein [Streptomyces gardneri]|uniref:sulfotransferase family protein n=1 Tax=Streptomyces gardneri TaxID=66892 RepID=UPI0036900224
MTGRPGGRESGGRGSGGRGSGGRPGREEPREAEQPEKEPHREPAREPRAAAPRACVAWSVEGHVALPSGRVRRAARETHHGPFPDAPELLARAVRADAHGVRARYLFASAEAAAGFSAARDPALTRLGAARTGPVSAVPDAPLAAPVIIVSPPRSGSTALFDALARNTALWTAGGESEGVIEGVPALHPAARGYASHALDAEDADTWGHAVRAGFLADLRDAHARRPPGTGTPRDRPPRLLEKTPENSLRLPFLLRLFPDATVVRLHRDARDTVASMVRAWTHPGFVNIPDLPGWPRRAWHLLLPPGWRGWAGEDLARVAARQWAAAVEGILDARDLRPAVPWVDVDYAELCAAPARTLRRLEAELDLPAAPRGRDLPLSATTIGPPRPGKWRDTPGFDPAALDAVRPTLRRLTNGRTTMPQSTPASRAAPETPEAAPRRRPAFACWLHETEPTEPDPTGQDAEEVAGHRDEAVLDPTAVLQTGVTIPLGMARRARFRDRFLSGRPLLWTDDAETGALVPYWVRFEDFWALRELAPGRPLPPGFPTGLRAALAGAGALGTAELRARRTALADAAVADAAEEFARSDVCGMGRLVRPGHREALLDYYERLIATGSWPLGDAQVEGRYGWYNESLSRFFHHQFGTLVGRLAGRPVRPSYAYVSAYRAGAVLDRHVDREQCEYTVSLLLGESGPGIDGGWPLLLDTARGSLSLVQRPGEAVLFRGTRVPHWRPPLPDGSTHTSLLFHYVPAEFTRTLY